MAIGLREFKRGMWVRHKSTGRLGEVISAGRVSSHLLIQFDPTGKRRHKKRKQISRFELEAVSEMVVLAEMAR